MKPPKTILIHHPDEEQASIYGYTLRVALHQQVRVVATPQDLDAPADMTVEWTNEDIFLNNAHTGRHRRLPLACSNRELLEIVRIVIIRRGKPDVEAT